MTKLHEIRSEPIEFYFVWTKKGRVPRFTHDTYQSAHDEATRLVRLYPSKKFIVLKAIEKIGVKASRPPEEIGEPLPAPRSKSPEEIPITMNSGVVQHGSFADQEWARRQAEGTKAMILSAAGVKSMFGRKRMQS